MTERSAEELERRRAYNRQYYATHKEEIKAKKKIYNQEHPEVQRAAARRYAERHRAENTDRVRRWRAERRKAERVIDPDGYRRREIGQQERARESVRRSHTTEAERRRIRTQYFYDKHEIATKMVEDYIASLYEGDASCWASSLLGTGCMAAEPVDEPPFDSPSRLGRPIPAGQYPDDIQGDPHAADHI